MNAEPMNGGCNNMLTFLKRIAPQPKADAEAARWLAGLATQQLFILSLNPSGKFNGDPSNTQEVIAWVEQNARETAAERPIDIYSYTEDRECLTPFFSSSAAVGVFIQFDPAHKWKAFTTASLTGRTLFKYLLLSASGGSKVVLNPRSGDERLVSPKALQAAANTRE